MARKRMLSPDFFSHELLAEIPMAGRMLFAGLWTLADRDGLLEDRPPRIRAQLFPYDPDVAVNPLLDALAARGFVTRYQVDGVRYLCIPSFARHQRPHPNEARSVIPHPPGNGGDTDDHFSAHATNGSSTDNQGDPITQAVVTLASNDRECLSESVTGSSGSSETESAAESRLTAAADPECTLGAAKRDWLRSVQDKLGRQHGYDPPTVEELVDIANRHDVAELERARLESMRAIPREQPFPGNLRKRLDAGKEPTNGNGRSFNRHATAADIAEVERINARSR